MKGRVEPILVATALPNGSRDMEEAYSGGETITCGAFAINFCSNYLLIMILREEYRITVPSGWLKKSLGVC